MIMKLKWLTFGISFLRGLEFSVTAETDIFNLASLSIGSFVDSERCYSSIEAAVIDNGVEKFMDPESYVDFVKSYGPEGFLEEVTRFEELPLILTTNFFFLACLCEPGVEDDCVESCVGTKAGIDTSGALSGDMPNEIEQSYLFLVCSQTSTSIDRVIQSLSPSSSPLSSTFPSTLPTLAPSGETFTQEDTFIEYIVGVERSETKFVDYNEDLIDAMDSLAPSVLQDMLKRQLRIDRSLQSDPTIFLPTSIINHTNIECPANLSKPADRCEKMLASVALLFQSDEEDLNESIVEDFEKRLSSAIYDGELQDFLDNIAVFIIDKFVLKDESDDTGGDSNAGIAVGVIVGVAFVAAVAYFVSGRQADKKNTLEDAKPLQTNKLTLDNDSRRNVTGEIDNVLQSGLVNPTIATGANDFDDSSVGDAMSNFESGDASSSNAGSSGWSSSAGIDSMNTSSADGLEFDKSLPLTAKHMSPLTTRDKSGPVDSTNSIQVTRDDLDSAIEAGDWAAVGATAALLAAASDSQSYSSKSEQYTGTRSRSGSSVSSLDVARAAELDHLVDAGDWEGVVLAAAKFEGDDGKESLPSASVSGSDTRSNADTAGQTADSSVASSKGLKRQEYRALVEDLVQRVVPEEIHNVDEMMLQFRGREDELVETLRTMQERAVAQKARDSSQKAAKQKVKLSSASATVETERTVPAKSSRSIGTGQVSATMATSRSLGTGEVENAKAIKSMKALDEGAERKPKTKETQTALEAAIEAGDWDAVGEAAALLTDSNSLSSADTGEINKYADGVSTDGSSAGGSKNLADVADELEELIEAGDWTGVVKAATKQEVRRVGKKDDVNETRRVRRLKHLQEEQEALAQAEIWTAIAEQSKQESETANQGAVDAADWAISRSLNALVEAELNGINDQSTIGTDMESLPQGSTKDDEEDESGNEV